MRYGRVLIVVVFGLSLSGHATEGDPENVHGALEGVVVEVIRNPGERWHVEAHVVVPAERETVWTVLTDYDHMAEFIPSLTVSRSTHVAGFPAVEQIGQIRFLFFKIEARALFLQNEVDSTNTIFFTAVEGDFHQYEGWWKVLRDEHHPDHTIVRYRAVVHPKIFLPNWIIKTRVKKEVRKSLEALTREIIRREKEFGK